MNHTLEVIKTTNAKERAILIKYGACFFHGTKPIKATKAKARH